MFTRRRELIAALLLACPAAGALAHGVHSGEAAAIVTRDRVVITREIDADPEASAPPEIIVRGAEGRRLPGRVIAATPSTDGSHVTVQVEHPVAAASHWLSFQLAPDGAPAARAHRVALTITDATTDPASINCVGSSGPHVVTLTSGGNIETLRFPSPFEIRPCGWKALDRHPERLQAMQAVMFRSRVGDPIRLTVVLPMSLAETWQPIPRADADVLSVAEQQAAGAAIAEIVASRVRMRLGGELVRGLVQDTAFLGLDDVALADPEPRQQSAWTSRVRVSLSFAATGTLEWDLWNARVLTASVIVLDGDTCEEREISTYAPTIAP